MSKKSNDVQEILTLSQAAELLQCSERTLLMAARDGQIPYGLVGSHKRFLRSEILRLFKECHPESGRLHVCEYGYDDC